MFNCFAPMGTAPVQFPFSSDLQSHQRLSSTIGQLTNLRSLWSRLSDRRKAQSLDIASASLDDLRANLQASRHLRSNSQFKMSRTFLILTTLLVFAAGVGWFHQGRSQCPVPNLARVDQ